MKSTQSIPLHEYGDIVSGSFTVNSYTLKEYVYNTITLNYRLTEEFEANATNLFQLVCLYLTQRLRNAKADQYFDILMEVLEDIAIPQYHIWLQEVNDFGKVKIRANDDLREIVECRFLAHPHVKICSDIDERSHIDILSHTGSYSAGKNVFNKPDDFISASIFLDQGTFGRGVLLPMKIGETADRMEQDEHIQWMLDTFAGKKYTQGIRKYE